MILYPKSSKELISCAGTPTADVQCCACSPQTFLLLPKQGVLQPSLQYGIGRQLAPLSHGFSGTGRWQMGQVAFMPSHLSRQSLWKVWVQSMQRRTLPGTKSSRQIGHLHSLSGARPPTPTTAVLMASICSSVAPEQAHPTNSHAMRMLICTLTLHIALPMHPCIQIQRWIVSIGHASLCAARFSRLTPCMNATC